jgi:hypothetical protein
LIFLIRKLLRGLPFKYNILDDYVVDADDDELN